jgi:hypothetical protein
MLGNCIVYMATSGLPKPSTVGLNCSFIIYRTWCLDFLLTWNKEVAVRVKLKLA